MHELLNALGPANLVALIVYILFWLTFELVTDYSPLHAKSMTGLMAEKRRQWMLEMVNRDLRMVDTQIIAGLQQGSAFFASTSIFAIGGCFALLGSTDTVLQIYRDLPMASEFSRALWEVKVLGLALLFAYTFFKFGWSYRIFNYCSILDGGQYEYHWRPPFYCGFAGNFLRPGLYGLVHRAKDPADQQLLCTADPDPSPIFFPCPGGADRLKYSVRGL